MFFCVTIVLLSVVFAQQCSETVLCPNDECCSQYGWCGVSQAYCGIGCQSNCDISQNVPPGRCGVDFNGLVCENLLCCSQDGWCGSSQEHCNVGCQSNCETTTPTQAPPGRCGQAFGGVPCINGECCSQSGWCGTSDSHCGSNCQSNCGIVDFVSTCTSPGKIVLTFDDGPSENIERTMDILEEKGVPGTFFVNGNKITSQNVNNILSRGFQLGDHSWSHQALPLIEDDLELLYEVTETSNLIEQYTGIRPTYFRPPFLAYSSRVDTIVKQSGMRAISINLDTLDYIENAEGILNIVRDAITGNKLTMSFIVLQHERLSWSIDALPELIDIILEEGFMIVDLDECV